MRPIGISNIRNQPQPPRLWGQEEPRCYRDCSSLRYRAQQRAGNESEYKSENGQNTSNLTLFTLCTPMWMQAPTCTFARVRVHTHTHINHITLSIHLSSACLPEKKPSTGKAWVTSQYYFFQSFYDHYNNLHFYSTSLFQSTFKTHHAFFIEV